VAPHLNSRKLDRSNVLRWDAGRLLRYESGKVVVNVEPLFGADAGTWGGQPRAVTDIENLFIGANLRAD